MEISLNTLNIKKFTNLSRNYKLFYKIVYKEEFTESIVYKNGLVYCGNDKPCSLLFFEIMYKQQLSNYLLINRGKWRRMIEETILNNKQQEMVESMKGFANLTNELILSNSK